MMLERKYGPSSLVWLCLRTGSHFKLITGIPFAADTWERTKLILNVQQMQDHTCGFLFSACAEDP